MPFQSPATPRPSVDNTPPEDLVLGRAVVGRLLPEPAEPDLAPPVRADVDRVRVGEDARVAMEVTLTSSRGRTPEPGVRHAERGSDGGVVGESLVEHVVLPDAGDLHQLRREAVALESVGE